MPVAYLNKGIRKDGVKRSGMSPRLCSERSETIDIYLKLQKQYRLNINYILLKFILNYSIIKKSYLKCVGQK